MKICSDCGRNKPDSCFSSRGNGKLNSKCKICHKIYVKEHYENNKEIYKNRARQREKIMRKEMLNYLEKLKNVPCMDCGNIFPPWSMDFDHRPGTKKLFNISRAANTIWSLDRVKKEIKKCDIICSNCHRDRTFKRLDKSRWEKWHSKRI